MPRLWWSVSGLRAAVATLSEPLLCAVCPCCWPAAPRPGQPRDLGHTPHLGGGPAGHLPAYVRPSPASSGSHGWSAGMGACTPVAQALVDTWGWARLQQLLQEGCSFPPLPIRGRSRSPGGGDEVPGTHSPPLCWQPPASPPRALTPWQLSSRTVCPLGPHFCIQAPSFPAWGPPVGPPFWLAWCP